MYLSDLHTHSIASGHGTSCTISNMARAASERGLRLLGITDHGPATLASGTSSYFRSLSFSPKKRFGVELLFGAEINILSSEGKIDLTDDILSLLDYAIVSMHTQNYKPLSCEENTNALLTAMKHPQIKILGHCDDTHYDLDYEKLVASALQNNIVFEINEASLAPYGYRGDTRKNCGEILHYCQKYQLPVILSSDSHGPEHIGDFKYSAEFVHSKMFPENLILNNQLPRLKAFLMCGGQLL